jgi:hypothetical protein
MKWFPFFKGGKHTDSKGTAFNATPEVLGKIIEMNKGREMALAIGHPKTNSPAWGWADELKRVGDVLYAKPKTLVPEFEAMVKKSMFKNVSVSLNPDMTIRHFGFLGATPPAIPGLQAEFAADDTATTIEFSLSEAYALQGVGSVFQNIRDFFIEKFDLETADRVISQWQIDSLKTVTPDDQPGVVSMSAHKPQGGKDMAKTVDQLQAELDQANAKLTEFNKTAEKVTTLETDLATERRKNQIAEFNAFLTSKEMSSKVSPAMMPAMMDFMQLLAGTETYEFSAPEGKKEAKAPVDAFKEFAKAYLPEIITGEEIATGKRAADNKAAPHEFMGKVAEFASANKVSEGKAVIEIAHAYPDLHQEWLATVKG